MGEVTSHEVAPGDDFLILASDGVWEFIESQEAVDIVQQALSENGGSVSGACERLISAAMLLWQEYEGDYRDDITAVVFKIPNLWGEGVRQGPDAPRNSTLFSPV